MRSVYVRPCNFIHGRHASFLIQKKQALPICGNRSIGFTHVEIITKKNKITLISMSTFTWESWDDFDRQLELDIQYYKKDNEQFLATLYKRTN